MLFTTHHFTLRLATKREVEQWNSKDFVLFYGQCRRRKVGRSPAPRAIFVQRLWSHSHRWHGCVEDVETRAAEIRKIAARENHSKRSLLRTLQHILCCAALEEIMLPEKVWEPVESLAQHEFGAKFKSGGDVAEIFPTQSWKSSQAKSASIRVGKRAIELESLVYWNHNALN